MQIDKESNSNNTGCPMFIGTYLLMIPNRTINAKYVKSVYCPYLLNMFTILLFSNLFESHINIYENETPKTKRTMYFTTISADKFMELNIDR